MVAADDAIMAGIVIAGVAAGAAAAAHNGGYYPGTYRPYGVAWDQFYNQYYQPIWRCRDRASGQFVDDRYCAGLAMHDLTWPGWA